jgi:hypothetical protein
MAKSKSRKKRKSQGKDGLKGAFDSEKKNFEIGSL